MRARESDPAAGASQRSAGTLDDVLAYIRAHLDGPLPVAGLAAIARLSVWRFSTVFRQRVGVPPHRYIRMQRVRRAEALLRQGMPAVRVASEVGFYDQSHLVRCFKHVCNMTPGQYQAGPHPSETQLYRPASGAHCRQESFLTGSQRHDGRPP